MSQQEQQSAKMSFTDFRLAVNLGSWVSHLLAIFVNVFLHCAPGERYIGLPGLIIIPVLVILGAFTQQTGGGAILACIPFYMGMCVIWNLWAKYRHKRLKRLVHSRYPGKPWILFLLPRWREIWVKKAEPFVVMGVGLYLTTINQPFGMLIFAAGLGQGLALSMAIIIQHGKELDQMDAMLDQQELAASAREMLKR